MVDTRLTFSASFRSDSANSPGLGPSDSAATRVTSVALAAGNNLIIGGGQKPIPREFINAATVVYRNAGNVANLTVAHTWRGLPGWIINGSGIVLGTSAGLVLNAVGDPTIQELAVNSDYRDMLVFSGAAATAMGSLAGVGTAEVTTTVRRSLYANAFSDAVLDVFADSALDSLPSVEDLAARTFKKIKAQGKGLLVLATNGNTTISIPGAAAAFGWRNPFIIAADIGNGFGQVPANVANRTAATFAPHPRAFIRSSDRLYQLRLLQPNPAINAPAIDSDTILLPLLVGGSRPTHSLWRVLIKGNTADVIFSHGTLDVRRPRDIWRQVIMPMIAKGGSSPVPIYDYVFVGLAPNLVKSFYVSGQLDQLEFLDYALCLDLLNSETTPVLQPEQI